MKEQLLCSMPKRNKRIPLHVSASVSGTQRAQEELTNTVSHVGVMRFNTKLSSVRSNVRIFSVIYATY